MAKPFLLGLDTETTGLDWGKGDRIIEFAGVAIDPESGVRLAAMVQRFDPQRGIAAGAQAVHGIGYEELVGQPLFAEKAPKVKALLMAADKIVIHNAPFDLAFIFGELSKVGLLTDAEMEAICAKVVDTCDGGRWATPNGKSPNLGELCFACGVSYDTEQAHGAAYDVSVMLDCYRAALRRGASFEGTT